jgi:hypothetical protein
VGLFARTEGAEYFSNGGQAMPLSHREGFAWYHVILTTYGAWLYGDSRGFRTRHHREHIDGDYKNPPPVGQYEALARHSRQSLRHPPVKLSPEHRAIVGTALVSSFTNSGYAVSCASVATQHVHILVELPTDEARDLAGKAKLKAWFAMRDRGWKQRLWAQRRKAVPITDQEHLAAARNYIARHRSIGAWVWENGPNARTLGTP